MTSGFYLVLFLCLTFVCLLIRYAVKLMYDRVAMGTADDEDEAHEEFAASLKDFETSWHIGPENATSWKEALKKGIPSLFSINFELSKVRRNDLSRELVLGALSRTGNCDKVFSLSTLFHIILTNHLRT